MHRTAPGGVLGWFLTQKLFTQSDPGPEKSRQYFILKYYPVLTAGHQMLKDIVFFKKKDKNYPQDRNDY